MQIDKKKFLFSFKTALKIIVYNNISSKGVLS